MAASSPEPETKLQLFLQWLQANGGELRGCSIKHCGPNKGFGIFSNENTCDNDIVMVVPLDLAITPMRVLQDPLVGPRCRALFEEGDVDDRFLVIFFLMVERRRPGSPWKPYLDMLPSSFGNPLWFTENELAELKGTTLYRASLLQKKKLEALYEDKVKGLVEELLHCDEELKSISEVQFDDFLWANSIFWTRALNIPFPRPYVFPEPIEGQSTSFAHHSSDSDASAYQKPGETFDHGKDTNIEVNIVVNNENGEGTSKTEDVDIVWVEGLVPGIDFCNHGLRPTATWEVDATGCITEVPTSMYLILAEKITGEVEREINISYGDKGNEELLYLYGFCIDNNPDDFLMVNYPMEAFSKLPFSDTKAKLLEIQLSEKMSRRGMNLTNSDHAIRLDLVAKARGIASAEEYFVSLPEDAKTHLAYGALLNCYCKELMTEKAEALMDKMKELRFASSPMSYNSLMTLYSKTGQPDKIPGIIQEMKVNDVLPDCFTYNIWMRSLAAMNGISGVERVMDEMKRDGRVAADWTTYSNLASIYVEAGMFQKAEGALKELERRNAPGQSSLEAYQYLITLYGRTGNLLEVYRIWQSLKLAYPKMANISYLNMIQVLVKLKDLPGAETCFKEWESKCSTYDVRIVNALLGAYLKEGMLEKAETFKKRAKRKGARLNAKSWEIFMEYYLKNGDMKSVLRCVDRGIKKGRSHDRIWVPPEDVIFDLMSYFEDKKDFPGAEGFIELLRAVKPDLGAEVFESLIRTYAAAGKKSPGMRSRLKMENVVASDITERLLEEVCVQ